MHPILFISGTRPEIIKLAPLYHALQETHWADVQWLHTGQHADMATQILACFDITPDITLTRQDSTLLEFSTGCRIQLETVKKKSLLDVLSRYSIQITLPIDSRSFPSTIALKTRPEILSTTMWLAKSKT